MTVPRLSRRENEIIREIAVGRQYKEIACILGLTESTIKQYVERLCHKLQVRGRTGLMAWLLQQEDSFIGFKSMAQRISLTPDQISEIVLILTTYQADPACTKKPFLVPPHND